MLRLSFSSSFVKDRVLCAANIIQCAAVFEQFEIGWTDLGHDRDAVILGPVIHDKIDVVRQSMNIFKYEIVQIIDTVVIRLIGKYERDDSEIDQVGQVNAGKAFGDHSLYAQEHRGQGSMFAR